MLFLALALHRVHVRDGQLRSAIKLAEAFELGAPAPQGVVAEGLLWNGRSQRAEAAPAGAHSLDAVHVVGVHGERQAVVVGLPDDARHVALEVRGAVTAAAGVVVVGKGGSVGDVSAGMHLLLRALGGLDEGGRWCRRRTGTSWNTAASSAPWCHRLSGGHRPQFKLWESAIESIDFKIELKTLLMKKNAKGAGLLLTLVET